MSSTENHKKAINITASCRGKKGALTAIYYKILEDHPAAIVNAAAAMVKEPRCRMSGDIQPVKEYKCPECKKNVSVLGIGGACGVCDPRGITPPY